MTGQNSTGRLISANRFYNTGSSQDSMVPLDQYKRNNGHIFNLTSRLVYTEPLFKGANLLFNYGVIVNSSHSDIRSFNKDGSEEYTILDSLYSNNYVFDQLSHRGGAAFNFFNKKVRFNVGTNIISTHYDQTDKYRMLKRSRSFINWNPTASFGYTFTSQRRFNFNYNGSMRQATIDQIQPLASNNDPLNIYTGNPDLKPSFTHTFSLYFSDYKVLTDRNIYANLYTNFTNNQITTNSNTDTTTGKNTYQYVNVSGNGQASLYMDYSFKGAKNLRFDFSPEITWRRNVNFVNGNKNISNAIQYGMDFRMSQGKDSLYDIGLSLRPNYSVNKSSLQVSSNNNYWTLTLNPDVDFYLWKKYQVHSDLDYSFRQKTNAFDKTGIAVLNAWFGRKLLAKDQLLIKISGNDILNQNKGISRNQYNNTLSQTITSTIRRYFLFSVVWNFAGGMASAITQ